MLRSAKLRLAALCFLALLMPLQGQDVLDEIKIKGERAIEVSIIKENAKEVEFADPATGATQSVTSSSVEWILYGDANKDYKKAVVYMNARHFGSAYSYFGKAGKGMAKSRGSWHKSYIAYYKGRCLYGYALKFPKKAESAVKNLNYFIKKWPKHRFSSTAQYYLAMSHLLTKNHEEAFKILEALEIGTTDPVVRALSRLGKARCYRAKGELNKAQKIGLAILKEGARSLELLVFLEKVLLKGKKDYAKGEVVAREFLKNRNSGVRQSAWEMIGSSQFYLKKYDQALESFLRARLLYSNKRRPISPSSKLYLALSLKALMGKDPDHYSEEEYKVPLNEFRGMLNVQQLKAYKKFKL